ncbi:Crp/Fnr family transcriptional regulator [Caldinitratiruptor microaerophilus]|uniref:cAMP-binding protein n=1 Tax=Caldinitratiruptor microaerophilus TaxID=671077 RepID=A0AA35CKC9_9FIRM|nr:Crp/Fnr family transcriptional regulator [Caldinitratiruptor microaerophilus]BDG59112.1 cAMP-binding protein [Caldinitratiruptor microaerophilus]
MLEPGALRDIAMFAGLSDEELRRVAACVHERRYRKGSVIFSEGEPGEAVYFVRHGRVKVYRVSPEGREQIIAIWTDNQVFGLVVALDRSPYPASAQAVEDSLIWMIRADDLHALLEEIPSLAARTMGTVAWRLRQAQDRVHGLSVSGVQQRLAALLLQHAREHGEKVPGGVRMKLDLTHQEIGGLIGASRETVTRVLGDFRREGAIEVREGDVMIVREEQLKRYLD